MMIAGEADTTAHHASQTRTSSPASRRSTIGAWLTSTCCTLLLTFRVGKDVLTCTHDDRRRGKYDRSKSKKPVAHAEQAWRHKQVVESFSIGRPCTSACKFERKCGSNIAPAVLLTAHEFSYGRNTRLLEMKDGSTCTYSVEFVKSESMRRWRELAAAAITMSNEKERRQTERLTVCKIGPVCQEYWAAAYGIPRGTANMLLAEARSGRLDADLDERGIVREMRAAERALREKDDIAAAMTVQWWELWLSLEDQMPNEAAIQHRTVVWQAVYDNEYIADIEWWGICRALSRSRWIVLREVALRNLSIQYFGHVEGSPDVPVAMLSLVERPKHSNFGMCNKCAAAKQKWLTYRR